ncbi:hypothetical protein [Bowmanella pacifica]|uniref:DUF883 domain-containing protein n=1 Tax=Bowmanella pacifica TaxID=502051 RepID=A0A917YSN7_9ALTE|nr:hypothetical protein [Bowmanella pacifica]GGO65172.1 hypothetical protein GCM10010982_06340 [Bowmanella pacifica]
MKAQSQNIDPKSKTATGKGQAEPLLSEQLADTLHHSIDAMSQKASATEQGVRNSVTASSRYLKANKQKLERNWARSGARKYATEHPVMTAGVAFGLGVVITALLRKGR